jgi:monoamine oxidase
MRTAVRRLRAVSNGIEAAVEGPGGIDRITADYCVVAIPPPLIGELGITPSLRPSSTRPFALSKWAPPRSCCCSSPHRSGGVAGWRVCTDSNQPIGAVWDGNEQQRGRAAILTCLAGGDASGQLQQALDRQGHPVSQPRFNGLVHHRAWSPRARLTGRRSGGLVADMRYSHQVGIPNCATGCAPHGRLLFAGEHTSVRWQGYMNGAIESGQRAAAEVISMLRTDSR